MEGSFPLRLSVTAELPSAVASDHSTDPFVQSTEDSVQMDQTFSVLSFDPNVTLRG